ncbi:MAG: hypothetical protein R3C44_16785 [Chloroflexota bacterium]
MQELVSVYIVPQLDIWANWIEINQEAIQSFRRHNEEIRRQSSESVSSAKRVLHRYKWFVTPSMPFGIMNSLALLDREPG